MKQRVKRFIKNNIVMCIALIVAVITMFIVPPNSEYFRYIDYKTIACLFGTLAVVRAFKNINFFYIIAKKVISVFRNTRFAILALIYITFIGSMFLANDMALLTFLPLGYILLTSTNKQNYMAFTFIMQNIAANLGGMLTPFGNPQNLYLYTKFNIPNAEFLQIMFVPFAISMALITVCCLCIKSEPLEMKAETIHMDKKRVVLYSILFILAISMVFKMLPYYIVLPIIVVVLFFADKKALTKVDYPLLLTFVFFFILAGNIARMDIVKDFFSSVLSTDTMIVSALSCQCISNVPSAILLSQFTDNYKELLLGVNIGGVGTLIASLASLITFREYTKHRPKETLKYIGLFSAFNFSFLIVLLICCKVFVL